MSKGRYRRRVPVRQRAGNRSIIGKRDYRCPVCGKLLVVVRPLLAQGPDAWDVAQGGVLVQWSCPFSAAADGLRALEVTCTCGASYRHEHVMTELYPNLPVHPNDPQAPPNPMAGRPSR